ncbi:acyltransferase family protein [Escherichia coli]|uniref:acyltransferase family protein n=1 Tax=Escherichia coli TaxID=562 RepID=UPI000B7F2DDC|nr:acyltransferase family protein [Escherichia coli]EEV5819773.1 hypothetical protein [Escherichia coli]EIN5039233.1 acyltransferase [Escherichia coli]
MSINYRPDIDGLRAVAVISVLVYHAFPNALTGGFVGVDVFFVISGYLISGLIIKQVSAGAFSFSDFYARRVKRIFPALTIMLITTMVMGYIIMMPGDFAQLGKHIVASALSVQNFMLLSESGYFDGSSDLKPLLHIWSLGVEEQFYLVWPIFLMLAFRFCKKPIVLISAATLISFVACVYQTKIDSSSAFYLPWFRLWELSIGCVAYLVGDFCAKRKYKSRAIPDILSFLCIVTLIFSLMNFNSGSDFPGSKALAPVISSAILIALCKESLFSRRVLSDRFAVYIGKISYPLYIWHWPLLSFYFYINPHLQAGEDIVARTGILVVSTALAAVTYHLVESNIRFTKGFYSKLAVSTLCGLSVLIVASGAVTAYQKGLPSRYGDTVAILGSEIDFNWKESVRGDVCHIMDDKDTKGIGGNRSGCVSQSKHQIFLWGDSHAGASYPGVKELARRNGYDISQITGAKRVPLKGVSDIADEQYSEAMGYITKIKPEIVMLDARWTVHGKIDKVKPLLAKTIHDIKEVSRNTKIIVVGPAPEWTKNLQNSLFEMAKAGNVLPKYSNTDLNTYVIDFDLKFGEYVKSLGVGYLSLISSMCNHTGCMTTVSGDYKGITAIDYGHLSREASRFAFKNASI